MNDGHRPARPSVVNQRVQGRPHGAAGVQHVVHQHHALAGDLRQVARLDAHARPALGQVVAIQPDIERADRDFLALELADGAGDALGEGHTARAHADDHQILRPPVVLDDLVADPGDGAPNVRRRHDVSVAHQNAPFPETREEATAAKLCVGAYRPAWWQFISCTFPASRDRIKGSQDALGRL